MKKVLLGIVMYLAAFATATADGIRPGASIAFFGIHFIDTSTEGALNGVRADEQSRIAMLDAYVLEEFTKRGFNLLDVARNKGWLVSETFPLKPMDVTKNDR